jgi:hypothetical protein
MGVLVPVVGVFISLLIYFLRDRKIKIQQEKINNTVIERYMKEDEEKKKAFIDARVIDLEGKCTIRVYNKGAGVARDVRLISHDIGENNGIEIYEEMFFPSIKSGSYSDLVAYVANECNHNPSFKFTWNDDYSEDNERTQILSF